MFLFFSSLGADLLISAFVLLFAVYGRNYRCSLCAIAHLFDILPISTVFDPLGDAVKAGVVLLATHLIYTFYIAIRNDCTESASATALIFANAAFAAHIIFLASTP